MHCLNTQLQAKSSHTPLQVSSAGTRNVDEFFNDFLKLTNKPSSLMSPGSTSNSSPSSASSTSNLNNSHFLNSQTFHNHDNELIELLDYTSQFNMDDDTTTSSSMSRSSNCINEMPSHFVTNQSSNNQNALNSSRSMKQNFLISSLKYLTIFDFFLRHVCIFVVSLLVFLVFATNPTNDQLKNWALRGGSWY